MSSEEQRESKHPWDQLDGETAEQYRRFCVYLMLGPARSVEKAYASTRQKGTRKDGRGGWQNDCAAQNWVERAAYWDIAQMADQGQRVITRFVRALEVITEKALRKLEDKNTDPEDWKDALDAIRSVGSFVPAESVRRLQDTYAEGEQPGVGVPDSQRGNP